MFDVPPRDEISHEWKGEVDLSGAWNVGLIVGPSGSGKSTVARDLFGDNVDAPLSWGGKAVVDDFAEHLTMGDIADACSAVGFNTIPSWLKPYDVLSTGEKFRVQLARRLLEAPDPIVVDEFTSVVDRQVAQIGSFAVQRAIRKAGKRFVAVTCHHDVVDWLQPDWVLEPATMTLTRRSVQPGSWQRCPSFEVRIGPVAHDTWRLFAPFHYLTNTLHRVARCFALFVGDSIAAISCCMNRPVSRKAGRIVGCSRLVTLPDWQGVGLARRLNDALGAAFKAIGWALHTYPAHPTLIRSYDRNPNWQLRKKPGTFSTAKGRTSSMGTAAGRGGFGGRPCAVFRYVGEAAPFEESCALLQHHHPTWVERARRRSSLRLEAR